MSYLKELLSNHAILASVSSWAIAEVIKLITNFVVVKELDFKRIFGDGGMPSAHTATVISLAIMSGYLSGFGSVSFAIALIFAIVVMKDAVGVRLETAKQAKSIKELAEAFNKSITDKDSDIRTENLKLLVGHTPLQVIIGAIIGVLVTLLYIIIVF
jgi:acid phosphatase family membrane protein YuiD